MKILYHGKCQRQCTWVCEFDYTIADPAPTASDQHFWVLKNISLSHRHCLLAPLFPHSSVHLYQLSGDNDGDRS